MSLETSPATTQASDSDTTHLRKRSANMCRIKLSLGHIPRDSEMTDLALL